MKNKNRVLAALLALTMTIGGCGVKKPVETPNAPITETETAETTTGKEQSDITSTSSKDENHAPLSGQTVPSARTDTGTLTENATEYEGIEGMGNFNYGEALQKSILFYELQRSGDLPETTRCNWRGDSGLTDGSDAGTDLTGGLYDAGDNAKFNLPMAYTSSVLAWSVLEDYDSYEQSGQLEYQLDNIRWVNDYLIKCHTAENEYYYQVGDGNLDHSWWGPSETLQMSRPSYKATTSSPASTPVAAAAASLAACSAVFKDSDSAYAETCLTHAKQLFAFAENTKSDSGYTAANGFYNSHSGFYDELTWAAVWLYTATNDNSYLDKAKNYYNSADTNYKWTMCWDNVSAGAALRLAMITGDSVYKDFIEKNLNFWCNEITYTPKGLAWLDSWGSLRYATSAAFIAAVYSESDCCPSSKKDTYWNFAVSQIDYALGSTGRSFVCGFGENYPVNPHHRTAQGSYCDNMNEPSVARHTLYGALVGGPDANDNYNDVVSDYTANEVACDYNAGFTGALAKLYSVYHGKTLVNFGAVEEVTTDELYVDACINASGSDFTEIKAVVCNVSAWPARICDKLALRYYFDLSEIISAGGSASDVKITTNYMQSGTAGGVMCWDQEKNIYYVEIDFSGDKIAPGGQDKYKREVQFRISCSGGFWDASNDPSYASVASTNGTLVRAASLALYDDGVLVFGSEPDGEGVQTAVTPSQSGTPAGTSAPQTSAPQVVADASNSQIGVKFVSSDSGNNSNLSINLEITNLGTAAIALSDLSVEYYFTKDGSSELNFSCDHSAAVNGDVYTSLSSLSGTFSSVSGKTDADTVCKITCDDSAVIESGGVWKIQVRINKSDWSNFSKGNDYSGKSAENVLVYSGGKLIFGKQP